MARGQTLVAKHQCTSCHGADLAGRDAIPRIRDQREDYLAKALAGYKSNARPGYDPAMNEVAQELSEADIRIWRPTSRGSEGPLETACPSLGLILRCPRQRASKEGSRDRAAGRKAPSRLALRFGASG